MNMKFRSLALPAILLCSLANGLSAEDGGVRWLGSYREALAEAKKTQKPIFIEFRCEP